MTETITSSGQCLSLQHKGRSLQLPALWLRERCSDAASRDKRSWQRLFEPARLPLDLSVIASRNDDEMLELQFSDGHTGCIDWRELETELAELSDPRQAWDGRLQTLPRIDYSELDQEEGLYRALRAFWELGFVIIDATPTLPDTVLRIAERFGHVRDTNFGRLFDVQIKPDEKANDLAYSGLPLPPHTDSPYRNPVPGVQLLHALVNDTEGGLSTLVDGLAVTRRLEAEDPMACELLARTPVHFVFRDPGVTELHSLAPLIERDYLGRFRQIRYSSRLDYVPLLPPERLADYYRARQRLASMLAGAEMEIRFRLDSGMLVLFDNHRLLHGRTEFRQGGERHLQGCYIDHDEPESRFRVLAAKREARQGKRG